jgi:alpha-maltose-1-phosphate synthase
VLVSIPSSETNCPVRQLFLIEYALGHRTHARFLEEYLQTDSRFQAAILRLHDEVASNVVGRLTRLPGPFIPLLRKYGVGFWIWRIFQHHRAEAERALGMVDKDALEMVYVHTHTAGLALLTLPPRVSAIVSADLTWKLVFTSESRYAATRLFAPIYALERRVFERADLIVSFSDWAAASVTDDYGIPASKVTVVRNAVTLPAHGTSHRHPGQFRIGFVGNEFRRKGGDLLLRVHQAHLADEAELVLVTNEPLPRGTLKNVRVFRDVPWDHLMTAVMPSFDLFVFPTRFDYSPYVVIEAMSLGLPVVASRVGAIPEMIRDGIEGFAVAPGSEQELLDCISWMMQHPEERRMMGESASRRAAEEYVASRNYRRLLDLLAEQCASVHEPRGCEPMPPGD